jgi:hypothetical protein
LRNGFPDVLFRPIAPEDEPLMVKFHEVGLRSPRFYPGANFQFMKLSTRSRT